MFDRLFKMFMKLQIYVFRRSQGKRMAFMRGMPILLLNTRGRKSGAPRTTPLMYLQDRNNYAIIASNNGRDRHPDWFFNLQATPQAEIELPGQRLKVSAAIAAPEDRTRIWALLVARAPFYEDYRKKTTRQIPLVILSQT